LVKKAIIPAAGLGTRFLPVTKVQPKEMLPIIDTPVIQYVVQEAIDSGIEDILIISGKGKRSIEDHFDRSFELEARLLERGDEDLYNEILRISDMANIHFIRQKELNGLGDAIYYAKQHTGSEPFAVLLGDTIIESAIPATQQLIDIYEQFKQVVIGAEIVSDADVSKYGIIGGTKIGKNIIEVSEMVEKPSKKESPSNFAIAGRYILTPEIYKALESTEHGKNNEIQLTDALKKILNQEKIYSCILEGKRHDIGNKLGYITTTIEYALKRSEFNKDLKAYLRQLVKKF
jgi:UTP--glucose-1-phosphate uridylyltransferase